jgi:putative ABC transport system permease protein
VTRERMPPPKSGQPARDEVDDELDFHLASRVDDLVAEGLRPDDARAQAVREFGDVDDARRYMRQAGRAADRSRRRTDYMGAFWQDVTHAVRRLRAAPVFAATAVLTLALGIGANAAIFSIVNGVLLKPLPFPVPGDLFAVYSASPSAGITQGGVSPVDLDDWRAARRTIADLGGYFYGDGSTGVDLTGRGSPRRLSAVFVTAGFFDTLGVRAEAGRLPREDEMTRGGHDTVVMLTHGFWMREFGGVPAAVGSTLNLNGRPFEVLGVLPPEMRFPTGAADVFVPYSTIPDDAIPRLRQVRILDVVARAKPGITGDGVRAEMSAIAGQLARQYPEDDTWGSATVVPLAEVISGPVRQGLVVLFGAVGLVLLMACVNVASLQLTRAMERGREIAVGLALGAGRGRLVRQLLTESLVLSALGGVVGMVLASFAVRGLLALSAGQLPRADEVGLDAGAVVFTAVVSVFAGLAFGLVPALRAARGDAPQALREGGRSIAGPGGRRIRAALVVGEVALAMMLVVGAGLMGRSFLALVNVDAGFQPDHLLAVQFTISTDRHDTPDGGPPARGTVAPYALFYEQVINTVRALPGVVSAAAVKDAPFRGHGELNSFAVPGRPVPAGEEPPLAPVIHVSDGYFSTIGARIVDGREFTPRDRAGAPAVVVVNEAFARQVFPGERAVGKTLLLGGRLPAEIVGVVNDIRQLAMATPARPTMYYDNLQNSRVKTTVVVRTAGDPLSMVNTVRDAIWSLDPAQPITEVFTFDAAVSRALARPRLLTVLLGAFGLAGLLLGAIGIYGVLSALVGERRREIGVRLALGARPDQVLRMIVQRGLGLSVVGAAIGLAGALALGRFLTSVLYGVQPTDPATLAGTAAVLLGAAGLASWWPARRAARLDPLDSLRGE